MGWRREGQCQARAPLLKRRGTARSKQQGNGRCWTHILKKPAKFKSYWLCCLLVLLCSPGLPSCALQKKMCLPYHSGILSINQSNLSRNVCFLKYFYYCADFYQEQFVSLQERKKCKFLCFLSFLFQSLSKAIFTNVAYSCFTTFVYGYYYLVLFMVTVKY